MKEPNKIELPSAKKMVSAPPVGPSYATAEDAPDSKQQPLDAIEEESMESFPASDPPSHGVSHV